MRNAQLSIVDIGHALEAPSKFSLTAFFPTNRVPKDSFLAAFEETRTHNLLICSQKARNSQVTNLDDFGPRAAHVCGRILRPNWPFVARHFSTGERKPRMITYVARRS